jgi:1-acyl-sn-glycerol-3-phosphate acyltransferase
VVVTTSKPGAHTHLSAEDTARIVLDTVCRLVREIHPGSSVGAIGLDSRLIRDVGLDSLGIAELGARLEDAFSVQLPEGALASVETPRDFLAVLTDGPVARMTPAAEARPEPLALEAVGSPANARTLVEVLGWHAQQHPDRVHLRILGEDGRVQQVSYRALHEVATGAAAGLRARGVTAGSSVAIMLPTSLAYFTTFFGVLLAGGVPVPVYPPARRTQLEEQLRRHVRILDNTQTVVLVTVPEARHLARLVAPQVASLRGIATPDELQSEAAARSAAPQPTDVALLQYTSGSTGDPKGVVLSHANLLASIRGMGTAGHVSSTDVFVSWLPLYHDMGLIGAWLTSLHFGFPLVVMSPLRFLARPARWLQAIHEHGGTISGAPNFGYELCLRRSDDDELEGIDLASWRIAFNGAEPVSPDTVTRFAERFARFGLRPEALTPVYGLAECAVALTVPPLDRGARIDRVARQALARHGRAEPADHAEKHPARHVACGKPLPGHHVRIVDDAGRVLPDRREGRIQFRGPSATSGYYRNPQATRELFDGDWLNTGDLGYVAEGDLFVTGRTKDLIIRAGRNLHPAELEEAVGALPAVRKGCVAAFASTDAASGTERLVIVAETRETDQDVRDRLIRTVNETTVDLVGTPPDEIVLAPPGTVPKTSSGKIRRAATRERYETRALAAGRVAVWRQVARVGLRSVLARVRRGVQAATGMLYGVYAWTLFVLLAVPTWTLVLVVPTVERRWSLVRRAGLVLLWLCAVRITVEGSERLPERGPYVVVANHASFVDPLMVMVAVPGPVVFAAIGGLARNPVVAVFLRRVGAQLVGSGAPHATAAPTHPFEEAVRAGGVAAFFPEGTRSTAPGLEPFRMGAFVVAADTGVPVVPLAIRGTRQLLPADRTLPRHSDVHMTVAEPLRADEPGWHGAAELQRAAREAILRHLDDADLG